MAFECSFQSLSYKSFANIPQKGGSQAPWAPPLNPPLGGILQRLDTDVHSAVTAKTSTAL